MTYGYLQNYCVPFYGYFKFTRGVQATMLIISNYYNIISFKLFESYYYTHV